jgi:hypothetical protein
MTSLLAQERTLATRAIAVSFSLAGSAADDPDTMGFAVTHVNRTVTIDIDAVRPRHFASQGIAFRAIAQFTGARDQFEDA